MLFVALIIAVCAAIWLAVWLRFMGLQGGVVLSLLAGTVFGHPFFHRNLGPVPLTSDRVLLAVVGVLAVFLLRFGKAHLPQLTRCNVLAVAFVAFLLVSTLAHDWRANRFHPLATWLFFYAVPLLAFLLMQMSQLQRRHLVMLVVSWLVLACYLGVLGVFETREWHNLIWPRFIADATYSEFYGRARGPLLNPIGNGILLTVGLAAALNGAIRMRGWRMVAALTIVVICAAGIYLTRTRSVWLGAAVVGWIVWVVSVPRRVSFATTMVGLFLGCVLISTQWHHLNAFKRDRDVSVAEMSESAALRPILATIAWKMFQDHPLLGVGFGQYQTAAQPYCGDRDTSLPLDKGRPFVQHNVFLSLLTETGLIGVGLCCAFLLSAARQGYDVLRCAEAPWQRDVALLGLCALAAYVVNGMFHEVAIIPMTNFALYALLGMVASAHVRVATAKRRKDNARARIPASLPTYSLPTVGS